MSRERDQLFVVVCDFQSAVRIQTGDLVLFCFFVLLLSSR